MGALRAIEPGSGMEVSEVLTMDWHDDPRATEECGRFKSLTRSVRRSADRFSSIG